MSGSVAVERMAAQAETSIIAPLFYRNTTRICALAMLSVPLLMVLLIPPDSSACQSACALIEGVHEAALNVALIERLAQRSEYPWTLSVSYFSALLLSLPCAGLFAFTRLRQLHWSAFRDGGLKMLLGRICGYGLWAAQFLIAPETSGLTRGNLIALAIQNSRIALAIWVAIIFAASTLVLVAMLMELLARTSKGRETT